MFYTEERSINLFINVTFLFERIEFLTTNVLKRLQKYNIYIILTLTLKFIMTFVNFAAFHTIYDYPIFERKNGCETHLIFLDVI